MIFENRVEAGRILGAQIRGFKGLKSFLVLAIPRGGVVVGRELATSLNCPIDIIVTKKIGAPGNPELAIGAIGPGGKEVIDEKLAKRVGADEEYIRNQIAIIKNEIVKREKRFRVGKPPLDLKNKTVIVTDDGVATGATMMAAIDLVRQHNPQKIVVAVPVIARDTLRKIERLADEVIYLDAPELFFAVGQFYKEFPQISDEEVIQILRG